MPDFTVQPAGPGWYVVSDGTTQWRVAVATAGDRVWAFANGVAVELDEEMWGPALAGPSLASAPPRRKKRRGEHGVMAPMPATVLTINVRPGQAVAHGDTLIVLEAMKMELPIRAPRDGVVKTVSCAKGDLVQPGVTLLEFEE